MKGKFITFEGCEGAGKSKQIKLLREYLQRNNIKYVLTREPGGAVLSEKIREILLSSDNAEITPVTEALLFAAARAQHVNDVIKPSLEQGVLVLCDRFIDSSLAYQGVANGLGFDYVEQINNRAIDGCYPDATIFLKITPEEAFSRKGGADLNDRIEQSGMDFHKKVYSGYLTASKVYTDRFLPIDCSGTVMETHNKIINALKDKGILP
ncbi:MAG: dTMP kinase [Clostridia bacterium]|nr:dTMP kinase [Clostridia bacterium]